MNNEAEQKTKTIHPSVAFRYSNFFLYSRHVLLRDFPDFVFFGFDVFCFVLKKMIGCFFYYKCLDFYFSLNNKHKLRLMNDK